VRESRERDANTLLSIGRAAFVRSLCSLGAQSGASSGLDAYRHGVSAGCGLREVGRGPVRVCGGREESKCATTLPGE